MKRIIALLLMLLCCVCFTGCGDGGEESSNTGSLDNDSGIDEEKEFSFPYDIETDDGLLQISNIYLRQKATDHGYDGMMAIEFDCSGMDYDDYYWFDKDYSIYVYQGYNMIDRSIEIYDETLHKKSEVGENGKKFYFCGIDECKEEFGELYFTIKITIYHSPTDYELEITEPCTKCEIVEEFPQDVLDVYVETVLD